MRKLVMFTIVLAGCGADAPPVDEPVGGHDENAPPAPAVGSRDEAPKPESTTPPPSAPKPPQKPEDPPLDLAKVSCATPPPQSATKALALPIYAGTCPALAVPPAVTSITSSGAKRELLVFRPSNIAPNEKLPVVFLWHWLGGSAPSIGEKLEAQAAADKHRFVAIAPSTKGDTFFKWPFEDSQSDARVEEEAKFFDDMLACVAAALPIDKECVSSVGISAGALWTSQLAVARSERLASIVSLSGGVEDSLVRPWKTTPHRLPALVLWGGPKDWYPEKVPIVNFEEASKNLEAALQKDGHFVVECTHACGHDVPPFEAPPDGKPFDAIWEFVLAHPYWLAAGTSPYTAKTSSLPNWCANGVGKATPSTSCPY